MSMRNTANLARGCRACVASLAGFALVILSASFAAALYGPRTTIGTNYQQWSNTTSKNGVDQGFCGSTQVCLVLFQRAPQQKALIIEHVSCLVHVNSGELLEARIETRKGQTVVYRQTALVPVPTSGGWHAINLPVKHLVESGERVRVYFFNSATTDWLPECSISGKLK